MDYQCHSRGQNTGRAEQGLSIMQMREIGDGQNQEVCTLDKQSSENKAKKCTTTMNKTFHGNNETVGYI